MWNVLLPVAQFMPGFDPLGSILGCMILLGLAATYILGLVAIPAAFRALKFARTIAAVVEGRGETGDTAALALLMESTMAYREITDAALVAVEHDQVAAYILIMDEVIRRKAGFTIQETTDAALAIAAKRGNLAIARDALARAELSYHTPLDRTRERGDAAVEKLILAAEGSASR